MLGNAARPRPPCRRVRAVVLGLGLLVAGPARAASVVSSITVGGDEHALLVEIAASRPLGYLLSEGHAPFTLSLLFTDARFAFTTTRRTFAGDGLVELEARTLTREGSTVAKLDLRFAREAPYAVTRERLVTRLRVEVPGPRPPTVIRAAAPPEGPGRSAAAPPPGAPHLLDGTRAVLRAVRPESSVRSARLDLDVDGAAAVRTYALEHPARIIVDLQDARVELKARTIAVGQGLLRQVRVAQHTATAVRVVCDLAHPAPFRVEPTPEGLILHLGDGVR